ncbi:MAG: UPF0280 family protein [Rhizobiaceae bacterium]
MELAQKSFMADGRRLHLHHGPIDLIIEVFGGARDEAYRLAGQRFETVLDELVSELSLLSSPARSGTKFSGAIARRMQQAIEPYSSEYVTPMAAVAGAVADEILGQIRKVSPLVKAYVNNGGDVAFYLTEGQEISAAMAALPSGQIRIGSSDAYRGIATSGWRGRSHSLGIADSVSVIAGNAATADVAATMIANGVNISNHPNIKRVPAVELSPDSDLGAFEVTTHVGDLTDEDIRLALDNGVKIAQRLVDDCLIGGAVLQLKQLVRQTGMSAIQRTHSIIDQKRELTNAGIHTTKNHGLQRRNPSREWAS